MLTDTTRRYFMNIKVSIAFGIISLLLIFSSFMVPSTHAVTLDLQARDCDDNAVIRCGAASTSELLQKYNSQADVRALFSSFGISRDEIQRIHTTAVAGIVDRNGNVTVDGRVVATGAMTAGRQNIGESSAVSAGGTQFYKRSPNVSFQTQRLKAFVVMTDSDRTNNRSGGASGTDMNSDTNRGKKRFAFAIIASCGNPVTAQPKAPPQPAPAQPAPKTKPQPQPTPQPTPQPAPAPAPQSQTQNQSQQQSATANATVTINKTEQPAPAPPQTVVERVEVPVAVPQPVAAAPAPVEELPKTGMESVSSTVGIAGVAVLLGTVAHYLLSRRKAIQ